MRLPMPVLWKTSSSEAFRERYPGGRTLNVGGTGMPDAVNFDLQWDADVRGDAHELHHHFGLRSFDHVICTAVLQYCERPNVVVAAIDYVLRPGGLVYVDVPWVQPYCGDGEARDLWRFSEEGLRYLFRTFEIIELGVSIPAAPAIAYYLARLEPTRWRYVNAAIRYAAGLVLGPLGWTRWGRAPSHAGAFYLVARKPTEAPAR